MDENNNQQYGNNPQQGGGYDSYGYPDNQGYSDGYDSYGYADNSPYQEQGGYQDYGYAGGSQAQQYQYQQPQSSMVDYSQGVKRNKEGTVKFLLFLIPLLVAIVSIVGLLLEIGVLSGMDSLKPSNILGINKNDGDGNGNQQVVSGGYQDCEKNGGEVDVDIFPASCIKDGVINYKNYTQEEANTALKELEIKKAQNGIVTLKPSDTDSFIKFVQSDSVANLPKGLVKYTYKGYITMYVNNSHLPSKNDTNDVLVDTVMKFVESGDESLYNDDLLVLKAFKREGIEIGSSEYINSLEDFIYSGVDSARSIMTFDNGQSIYIRVFAVVGDNVIMLEQVVDSEISDPIKVKYFEKCSSENTEPDEIISCFKNEISLDNDIVSVANRMSSDLVSIFSF